MLVIYVIRVHRIKFHGSGSIDSDGVANPIPILRDTRGVMSKALESAVPFWIYLQASML